MHVHLRIWGTEYSQIPKLKGSINYKREKKQNLLVAMESHISVATLTRYIKKFEWIAEVFIHNGDEFRDVETSLKYIKF